MTSSILLQAEDRTASASVLRRNGRIPVVLYGHEIPSRSLSVSFLEFSRAYKAAGENTVVELALPGGKPVNTLIYDTQIDPLTGKFLHADFYQVRMDEKVETSVPLVFVGEAPAVRESGGIFVTALDEITVSCLPGNIPHELSVDISTLATFDDQIRVADIVVPEGVLVVSDADTVVALVERPRSDEEMASLETKVEADVTKVEGVVKEAAPASEKKTE